MVMVTAADYAADPDKFPDYVPIRKGTPSANDPLKFMYAPKELVDSQSWFWVVHIEQSQHDCTRSGWGYG